MIMERREFIKKSLIAATGTVLLGSSLVRAISNKTDYNNIMKR